jgi:hypothetical protein
MKVQAPQQEYQHQEEEEEEEEEEEGTAHRHTQVMHPRLSVLAVWGPRLRPAATLAFLPQRRTSARVPYRRRVMPGSDPHFVIQISS